MTKTTKKPPARKGLLSAQASARLKLRKQQQTLVAKHGQAAIDSMRKLYGGGV